MLHDYSDKEKLKMDIKAYIQDIVARDIPRKFIWKS